MAAAILYLLAGARYRADMKILVRPGRADAPVSAQENAPLDLTRQEITEEELNSEVELLRDDEVLRKVVEENGLGGRDWLHFQRAEPAPGYPAFGIPTKVDLHVCQVTGLENECRPDFPSRN